MKAAVKLLTLKERFLVGKLSYFHLYIFVYSFWKENYFHLYIFVYSFWKEKKSKQERKFEQMGPRTHRAQQHRPWSKIGKSQSF